MKIAGFAVKTSVVWDKGNYGMGDLTGNFSPSYETCIFATKGKYAFPGKRPRDVLQVPRLNGSQVVHPNEKPVELMKQLIDITTRPNDLILDPFAGSGTTLVAALQNGRRYIGVEISPQHYETAQRRIYEAAFTV